MGNQIIHIEMNRHLADNILNTIALAGVALSKITGSQVISFLTGLMILTAICVNIEKFLDYRDRRKERRLSKKQRNEKVS